MKDKLEMFQFEICQNMLHIRPGGTYDMVNGRGYELDVAKLHLLQCYLQSLIEFMCDSGELRKDYKAEELLDIARGLYDGRFRDIVENFSPWKIEFNPGKYKVPHFITIETGWEDISWHNDSCPRFFNSELGVILCIETNNPEDREYHGSPRLILEEHTGNQYDGFEFVQTLYECDMEESLRIFVDGYRAAIRKP